MSTGKRVSLQISGITSPSGFIDLYDDEPINILYSISDVTDLTSKGGANSQNFVCPGTPNNNKIFTQIFKVGITSGSTNFYDPNAKCPIVLFVDSIPVLRGILQITGISVERDDEQFVEYEVVLYDSTKDFQTNIGSQLINQLDWNDLNHTYAFSSITNSWTASTMGYQYPWIDYGNDFFYGTTPGAINIAPGVVFGTSASATTINQTPFYPAVYVSTLLEKIFTNNGFVPNITDPNFEEILDGCIIPFNGNPQIFNTQDFVIANSFEAVISSSTVQVLFTDLISNVPGGGPTIYSIGMPDTILELGNAVFNPQNLYNGTNYTYTGNTLSTQNFNFNIILDVLPIDVMAPIYITEFYVNIKLFSNQIPTTRYYGILTSASSNGTHNILNLAGAFTNVIVHPGETFTLGIGDIQVGLLATAGGQTGPAINITATTVENSYWYNTVGTNLIPGQDIIFSGAVPQQTKQIDIITSLQTMFNLYFEPDPYITNQINIAPRDNFFSSGRTIDWSSKWDSSQPIIETLISETQLNRFILNYSDDTDYYNQNYKNLTNLTFGEAIYYMPNTFTKGDDVNDVIFSPTPVAPVFNTIGDQFIIPKMIPYYAPGTFTTANGFASSNIRILQYNVRQIPDNNYWYFDNEQFFYYPYSGMINDPVSGTTDLSFSSSTYQYYDTPNSGITQNNLFNLFWKNYLNQISDPTAKIITAKFWLRPSDIANFRYNNQIFVQGLTDESGYYYIVNSLKWDPVHDHIPAEVELLKLPYPFLDINYNGTEKTVPPPIIGIGGGGWSTISSSIILGNSSNASTTSISAGINTTIAQGSNSSIAIGDGNSISENSASSTVHGTKNVIGAANFANTIHGNSNIIR